MGAGVSAVSSLGTLTAPVAQARPTQPILRSLASQERATLAPPGTLPQIDRARMVRPGLSGHLLCRMPPPFAALKVGGTLRRLSECTEYKP